MSREVLGLAPADAGDATAPARSGPAGGSRARAVEPTPDLPARRLWGGRRWPFVVAAVLVGSLSGWLLAGTAQSDATADTPGISAHALDTSTDFASSRPVTGTVRISLTNAGSRQVRLTGFDASVSAARIAGLDLDTLRDGVLPGRSTRRVDVRVAVACTAGRPLDLPSLRLRLADGTQRPLTITGGNAALAEICNARVATQLLVSDGRPHRDRQFYGVLLRAPSGRDQLVRVQEMRVGGYPLIHTPGQAMVGRDGVMVWLNPPGGCPRPWRHAGFPSAVDIEVDLPGGERASVRVEVGPDLAAWLLDACPGTP